MRKLLLATVAALGVTTGYGAAYAQQADDSGQSTVSAFGGTATGPVQAPGTLVVRLNGRVYSQGGILSVGNSNGTYNYNPLTGTASEVPFVQGVANATVAGAPAVLPAFYGTAAQATAMGFKPGGVGQNVVVQAGNPQTNKNGNYGIYSYFRLYPGFDGVAANGLRYGAGAEIRQDGNYPAGGGVGGSISSNTSRDGILYVRRAWGYVGTDKLGMVRFGATDGPSDLFMVGNNENFGDGGWNGSAVAYLPTQLWIYWPFADVGNLYSTQKIVYLSPAFAGFDFGLSFEPTTAGPNGAAANQGCNAPNLGTAGGSNGFIANGPGVAGAGCAQLISTTTGDIARRRNTYDVAVRYRGLFGPVGFAAFADYMGSGKVSDEMTTTHQKLDGLSVGAGGAQVTYGGLTIGAMAQGGRKNGGGSWNLAPQGASDEVAYEVGGSYTYGPLVVGAHFFQVWSAAQSGPALNPDGSASGAIPSVGQRRETGVAAGATYSVAPGFSLNLTYFWGERAQNGQDFLTGQTSYAQSAANTTGCGASGVAGSTAACLHNTVTAQGLMLGAQLTW
jgi:hypothetical protein